MITEIVVRFFSFLISIRIYIVEYLRITVVEYVVMIGNISDLFFIKTTKMIEKGYTVKIF